MSGTDQALLLFRDELSGWLGGMDRYNGGADRPFWLEAYGGRPYSVDRKTSEEPIVIDHLSVSVLGGIQPEKLHSLIAKTVDDGLLARFMIVFPEPVPLARPNDAIDTAQLADALKALRNLQPTVEDSGEKRPRTINLTEDAINAFQYFRQKCRVWEAQADGLMKSHIGKFHGLVLRISCVLAHLDWATTHSDNDVTEIDEGQMKRACYFVGDYLRLHAFRAYGTTQPPAEIRSARRLAALISTDKLVKFSVREIQKRCCSGLETAKEIKSAICVLKEADWIDERKETTGGRPKTTYFVKAAQFRICCRSARRDQSVNRRRPVKTSSETR